MAGKKGRSGGARVNSGRKGKAEELALAERLSVLDDRAFAALERGIERGDFAFTKMFFEYRVGKPQDKLDVTSNGETITAIKIVDVDGSEL